MPEMKKKDKKQKTMSLMECGIKIREADGFEEILPAFISLHFIYFIDFKTIAIYQRDQSERTQTDLPWIVIYIEEILNINFRIPQKVNDMSLEFHTENKRMLLIFDDESMKNQIGDKMKKEIKRVNTEPEARMQREYSKIEFKYRIAKQMEGKLSRNNIRQGFRGLRLP